MKLSQKTIQVLREIINEKSQYRSGPMLVEFFNELGFHDVYGQGFPSRWAYTEERLYQLNGTATLDQCIKNVFAPVNYIENPALLDELLELFNKHLQYDDWNVYIEGKNVLFRKVNFDLRQSFKPDVQVKSTAEFNSANASPKERDSLKVKSFDKWTLENYIAVAYELGYIKEDVKRFSHEVQNFRNYIHPYQQYSQKFNPTIDTAVLCTQVVKIAINQISEKGK